MAESAFDQELIENRRAWETLREQVRRDHPGEFVALAFGRIVASDRQMDKVMSAVQALDPKPAHYEVFPAEVDPLFDVVSCTYSEYVAK
jgi:hypothetical protein